MPLVEPTVLVTGATGFVGQRLVARLTQRGVAVRCASRSPESARRRWPGQSWVPLDVADDASVAAAVSGVRAAYYLVHSMAEGAGYAARDRSGADRFRVAAAAAGLERIVYLGGVAPQGTPSAHLASRLETGRILRLGPVPTIELRASMIIGSGSESWRICRDLAARLPLMVLPRWLESHSQPVAIDDVIEALTEALTLPLTGSTVFDLPGPEVMTGKDILLRVAHLRGMRPRMVSVPVLTPRLSSYWLRLVTGADFTVARELIAGLTTDLLATEPPFWERMPGHRLLPFEAAARRALAEEGDLSLPTRTIELLARRLAREG